jgi:hemerythrin superfamily protein
MAKSKKRASASRGRTNRPRTKGTASRTSASSRQASQDAIALLKADHRQVEEWFEQFESTRSADRKKTLATQICQALTVHTKIEEEIFYPAFLEATEEEDMHHEAAVEHDGAKKLIAQIEASGPDDDYYDAKVKVLSEMIKHHVKEEEQRGGMFAKARESEMDLKALGESLAARKAALMGNEDEEDAAPSRRGRGAAAGVDGVVSRIARRMRGG